jgi:flagellar hook-associated protein 1
VLRGQPTAGDAFTVREPLRDGAGRLIESMAQNTGNGQALLALRDANALDGYTLSDGYIPVFSSVASSIQTAKSAAEFSARVADQAEASRANQAGVNLDEEAARLLQYQQAYQAAAKYLQTIQGSFDTLIQAFR